MISDEPLRFVLLSVVAVTITTSRQSLVALALPLSSINIQSTSVAGEPVRGQPSLFEQEFGQPGILQQILAQLPARQPAQGSGQASNSNMQNVQLETGVVTVTEQQTPQQTATDATVVAITNIQAAGSNGRFMASNQGNTAFSAGTGDGNTASSSSAGFVASDTAFGSNGQLQLSQGEQGSSNSLSGQHRGAVQLLGGGENFNSNVQVDTMASHTSVSGGSQLSFNDLRCKVFGQC